MKAGGSGTTKSARQDHVDLEDGRAACFLPVKSISIRHGGTEPQPSPPCLPTVRPSMWKVTAPAGGRAPPYPTAAAP